MANISASKSKPTGALPLAYYLAVSDALLTIMSFISLIVLFELLILVENVISLRLSEVLASKFLNYVIGAVILHEIPESLGVKFPK
jgi:hypothetical protein